MDPQMVWDAMDESEDEADKHMSLCQSMEPEASKESFKEKPARKTTIGWMGFPVYGMNR